MSETDYDAAQVAMMEENCIVVDFHDAVVGTATKREAHQIGGLCMRECGMPHRAFSVFLFDED